MSRPKAVYGLCVRLRLCCCSRVLLLTLRAEIVRGVAPTVCQCLVSSAKQCATFVDVAFKHSFINGTLFNRMMKAATKEAEDARRAAAADAHTTASVPAATPALSAEVEEAGAE